MAGAPKAHESLRTEARRVPVQGAVIPLISVFTDLHFYTQFKAFAGKDGGAFFNGGN